MFRPFQSPKWCRYALSGATASWSTEVAHDLGMGGRPPALDKQTATGTRPAPAPARGRPRVAEEFPHRRNCPTPQKQKEGRSQPLRTTQPGSGGSVDHRGGAPCCAGRASTGAPISTSPTKRSWAGAGPHWSRQRAIGVGKLPAPVGSSLPRCEFPTPMRVSCPDASLLPRYGSAHSEGPRRREPERGAHATDATPTHPKGMRP